MYRDGRVPELDHYTDPQIHTLPGLPSFGKADLRGEGAGVPFLPSSHSPSCPTSLDDWATPIYPYSCPVEE